MKKTITAIMAAFLALLMTQCRKQVETAGIQPAGETMEVTLRVTSDDGDRTEITPSGVVTWKAGDKLYVVGQEQGLLGFVSAESAGDPVYFTGNIKALTSAQVLRFYYVGSNSFSLDGSGKTTFSIASQNGTLAGIAESNQIMWGKSENPITAGSTNLGSVTMTSLIAIAHINVTANSAAVASATVTGGKNSIQFNAKTYDGTTHTVNAGDIAMTFSSSSTNSYIALLPGTQTLKFTSDGKEATLPEKTVAANKFYNSGTAISVAMAVPASTGSGTASQFGGENWEPVFSVSATSTVKFSPGNLYHDSEGWKFEAKQYDFRTWSGYPSCINGIYNATGTGSNDCGLFVYTNVAANAYTEESYSEGASDIIFTNATETTANTDFHVNGETGTNEWRTLSTTETGGEWFYLLNSRSGKYNGTSTNDARELCGHATIKLDDNTNTVSGLVLLPDEFTLPSGLSFTSDHSARSMADTNNEYTTAEWSVMEEAGAVFLPAAGRRGYTDVNNVGSYGEYWSSTPYEMGRAGIITFGSDGSVHTYHNKRSYGNCVRLVREL